MRSRSFAAIGTAAVALAFGLWMSHVPNGVEKLDRALTEWLSHPSASTPVLVRTHQSSAQRIASRFPMLRAVSGHGDLFAGDVDASALRALTADRDVVRASSDALVHTFASFLTEDVLLNTEGLLPRTYVASDITVAVVDSGIQPNANEKVTATYDFVKGARGNKIGSADAFGHGTHV